MRLQAKRESILLDQARQDLAAFQELYEHYMPGIFAYVAYRVNRRQDIEDLVSDIFLKATRRLDQFEWRGDGSFTAWLFRIAHDCVVDFYRRNSKTVESVALDDLPELKSDPLHPEESALRKEQYSTLMRLLSDLSPRRQEVISLKFFAGLSNKEIAGVLDLDERTIASHLCRGLEDLHQRYIEQESSLKEKTHD
jgi:RNA polymerase sigma-70 factor (ECF subfamily)